MSGIYETLEADPSNIPARREGADTRPPPGIFDFNWEATSASAEQSFYDTPGRSYELRSGEIAAAAAELARINGKRPSDYYLVAPGEPIGNVPIVDEGSFWRDLREARRTRPDALKDLGNDRADYDKRLRQRFQAGTADRRQRMAKGGLIGNLLGGAAGAFTDPINIMTLPIGGGSGSAARMIISNMLINSGIEAAEQPFLALERQQQGGELTLGEAGMNIFGAGIGAGVLTGTGIAVSRGANKVLSLDDRAMASALRKSVKGDWDLSPQQAAALHVLERGGEIDATNPFHGTYEGFAAHAAKIDRVLADMARLPQVGGLITAASNEAARVNRPAPDFGRAWNAIVGIEGGTNRDGSFRTSPAGAIGPAQIMPGTAPEAARLAGVPFDENRYRTDPAYNAALGQAYYREMLRQFDGDPIKAAAAYNAGPGSARRGTGVRGAMARAERAGVPNDWISFLPAETRGYVANFKRRTGMGGESVIADAGADLGGEMPIARSPDLDAERPSVDFSAHDDGLIEPVALNREAFPDDASFHFAKAVDDAEVLGIDPDARDPNVIAFHGSPHLFDRFSTKHINSGEGNQSFGWGLYLSDTKKIAEYYRDLADVGINGREMSWDEAGAYNEWRDAGENIDQAIAGVREMIAERRASGDHRSFDGYESRLGVLNAWKKEMPEFQHGGHVYEVEIPPESGYLQWDKPLSEQSAAVREALPSALSPDEMDAAIAANLKGADLYDLMSKRGGPRDDQAASIALRDAGITGIKYLDGDSRSAGQGTHNYVLFDDSKARITAVDQELSPARQDFAEAEGLNGPPVVDLEAARSFDDPAGEGVAKVADSLWHDIEQAQEARGTAEAGELIDLDDGKGPRTVAEIQKELADDEADIATIESCLAPAGGGE